MINLHETFMRKVGWYNAWHSHKGHVPAHWFMFLFLAIFITSSLSEGINKSYLQNYLGNTSAVINATISNKKSHPILGQYIVEFKSDVKDPRSLAQQLVRDHGGELLFAYENAIIGFAAKIPEVAIEGLRRNPNVKIIEQDQTMEAFSVESPVTWGLDRIDQRTLPIDNSYFYDRTGAKVNAYIIDSGIRSSHSEFNGHIGNGADLTGSGTTEDCLGHGTHVSGTIGGTTYGVAKGVTLHPVRVFNCTSTTAESTVIAGMDWVAKNAIKPAVVNMSIGGPVNQLINNAVTNLTSRGITVAVAAGNDSSDACQISPASASTALTVGATDNTDHKAPYSNYGACLDVFAPGTSITSAYYTNDTAIAMMSGTSMATPHVTGVVALYLQSHPTASPTEVSDAIYAFSTKGAVQDAISTNWHLLYSGEVRDDRIVGDAPIPVPPIAPSNLLATLQEFATGGSYVLLTWKDNSNDEDGFIISGSSDTGLAISGTTRADLTSLRQLLKKGNWELRIRSIKAGGYVASDWARTTICVPAVEGDCATTPSPSIPPPASPTGFIASPSACGNNWLNLSWNASVDVTSYQVYRNGSQIYNGSATAFSDTGLTLGSTYSYTLTATNSSGTSALVSTSGTVSNACTLPPVPPSPLLEISSYSVTLKSTTSVNISWTTNISSTGSVNYSAKNITKVTISDPNNTITHNLTLSGLKANTSYSYQINAASASETDFVAGTFKTPRR
jgi:subtilisin family serine protease